MKAFRVFGSMGIAPLVVSLFIVGVFCGWCEVAGGSRDTRQGGAETEKRSSPKKAVVLFSYQLGWWGVVDEDKGLVDGLIMTGYEEGKNLHLTRLYMNTKTVNKTTERMEAVAQEMLAEIQGIGPDILFIMDDDALRHVGAKLLDTALPIVFAGVNFFPTDPDYGWASGTQRCALADSLEKPGHNVTGVLERTSLLAGFKLLHRILPKAKTALFVSDNSYVGTLFLRAAGGEEQLAKAPLKIVDKIYTDSFEKLKSLILEYQTKVDCIVLFLPWTFEDEHGNHVPQKEVVRWMLMNNKRPGVAYLDILADEGYLCGVVVDMVKQGFHAGVIGGKILDGEKPSDLPIVDPVANRITINLARAKQLGIEIPFEVLKGADVVFKKMTAYPEFRPGD